MTKNVKITKKNSSKIIIFCWLFQNNIFIFVYCFSPQKCLNNLWGAAETWRSSSSFFFVIIIIPSSQIQFATGGFKSPPPHLVFPLISPTHIFHIHTCKIIPLGLCSLDLSHSSKRGGKHEIGWRKWWKNDLICINQKK
jgi:hypothetical protein